MFLIFLTITSKIIALSHVPRFFYIFPIFVVRLENWDAFWKSLFIVSVAPAKLANFRDDAACWSDRSENIRNFPCIENVKKYRIHIIYVYTCNIVTLILLCDNASVLIVSHFFSQVKNIYEVSYKICWNIYNTLFDIN